jgi:hypothetical protein
MDISNKNWSKGTNTCLLRTKAGLKEVQYRQVLLYQPVSDYVILVKISGWISNNKIKLKLYNVSSPPQ